MQLHLRPERGAHRPLLTLSTHSLVSANTTLSVLSEGNLTLPKVHGSAVTAGGAGKALSKACGEGPRLYREGGPQGCLCGEG